MNFAPITRFTSRNALRIKRNSPQILFYAGILGTVATTVLASRATLKAVPVVETLKLEREKLDSFSLNLDGEVQHQDIYNKAVIEQYTTAGIALTKLYGPTIIIGVGSIIALTKSHQQLTSRNTALTMAYTGLFKTFDAYRTRVREELGAERDQQFLHGTVQQEIETKDKNGKLKTKTVKSLDPSSRAALTYYFDDDCASWCKDPTYNQNFLNNTQDWANVLLKKRGYIFLNDIYDMLKIDRIPEGQILGWIYKDPNNGDLHYVDFGHRNDGEFSAGFKKDVMLEFNVFGPILELI